MYAHARAHYRDLSRSLPLSLFPYFYLPAIYLSLSLRRRYATLASARFHIHTHARKSVTMYSALDVYTSSFLARRYQTPIPERILLRRAFTEQRIPGAERAAPRQQPGQEIIAE